MEWRPESENTRAPDQGILDVRQCLSRKLLPIHCVMFLFTAAGQVLDVPLERPGRKSIGRAGTDRCVSCDLLPRYYNLEESRHTISETKVECVLVKVGGQHRLGERGLVLGRTLPLLLSRSMKCMNHVGLN